MALIVWDQNLSVNIKEIDTQHKKLIGMINALHNAMKDGRSANIMGVIFTQLLNYTVYHFSAEEKLFQGYEYPESLEHKQEHEEFTSQVIDLKSRFEKHKLAITLEVMDFLVAWLRNHILGSDKRYSAYLNSKGVF